MCLVASETASQVTPSLAMFLNKKLIAKQGKHATGGRHSVLLPKEDATAGSIAHAIREAAKADAPCK